MSFEPSPQQTLLLWNMITGGTPEERQPMQSKTKPELDAKKRNELVAQGFLSKIPGSGKGRSRAQFLALTDKAWEWASHAREIELMSSKLAAPALQGLLRRLIPFLEQREIALAELFRDAEPVSEAIGAEAPVAPAAPVATTRADASEHGALDEGSLGLRIERACLSLAGGVKKSRVRLSALRRALASVPRQELDAALIELQRDSRLVLYRDDDTPALTPEDHVAALLVGDSPRHLVYLEA